MHTDSNHFTADHWDTLSLRLSCSRQPKIKVFSHDLICQPPLQLHPNETLDINEKMNPRSGMVAFPEYPSGDRGIAPCLHAEWHHRCHDSLSDSLCSSHCCVATPRDHLVFTHVSPLAADNPWDSRSKMKRFPLETRSRCQKRRHK